MPHMRLTLLLAAGLSATAALAGCQKTPAAPQLTPVDSAPLGDYKLVWSDEFDGVAGSLVDPKKWVHETGGSGWGNNERQYYTTNPNNASMDGAGHLVITARAEAG